MTFEDYKEAVKNDAIEAIQRGDYDWCTDFEDVEEALWIDDSVTGNGSGSYTFNTAKARENVSDLLWDDDFIDYCEADMCTHVGDLLKDGAETIDVVARCAALGFVRDEIEEAWNEYRNDNAA